jgi:hypothetical protein
MVHAWLLNETLKEAYFVVVQKELKKNLYMKNYRLK